MGTEPDTAELAAVVLYFAASLFSSGREKYAQNKLEIMSQLRLKVHHSQC